MTGYSANTNEEDLRTHFSQVGSIKEVVVKRGYAFIYYKYPEHAALAIKHFDGQTFRDKPLKVE